MASEARPKPPVIVARAATHAYARDGFTLGPVDLLLAPGSFSVILGPNGSGKSTLVRLLGGLSAPGSGSVTFDDRAASGLSSRERGKIVAFVTQDEPRRAPFTVFDVVMMGRYPHQGVAPFDAAIDVDRAAEAMRMMEVEHLARRILGDLSSGERQRVFLARALAQEPRVLMLDEPAANLDVAHQVELYAVLDRLNRDLGLTVVAVSHEMTVATERATQIVLLKNGRVQRIGRPADCLTSAELTTLFDVRVLTLVDPETGARVFLPRGNASRNPASAEPGSTSSV